MSELSALPDAGSLTGLELVPALQGADARKLSTGQIRTFIAPVGLRAAPRIAYLGDSILAHGQSIATNILQNNNIPFWTHFLGSQRYDFELAFNHAVGGSTTTDHLALIDGVLAAKPDILVYLGGTNDIALASDTDRASGALYTQMIANYGTLLDRCHAAAVHVVILPILPRQNGTQTAAFLATLMRVNHWLRTVAGLRAGVTLCDPTAALVEAGSAAYAPRAGTMWADNLHPAASGAIVIARELDKVLQLLVPARALALTSVADVWSTANPHGNLMSAGMMGGIAGTRNTVNGGTTPGGALADGWIATARAAGPIVTCAKLTHPVMSGAAVQEFAFSGTGASGVNGSPGFWIYADVPASGGNVAVGDILEAMGELDCFELQGVSRIDIKLIHDNGSLLPVVASVGAADAEVSNLPSPLTIGGLIKTPRGALGTGMTYARLRIDFWFVTGAALGGSVRMARWSLRKSA